MFFTFINKTFKSAGKSSDPVKKTEKTKDAAFKKKIPIGLKLILGVALISNISIFLLLYSVWFWDSRTDLKSGQLLQIQKDLNTDLRTSVTHLQKRLLFLPGALETDPQKRVIEWLKKTQVVHSEKTLSGRDSYKSIYTRTQRRDLLKGKFVVQQTLQQTIISKGIMDKNDNFSDKIHQIVIDNDMFGFNLVSIKYNIERIISQGKTGKAVHDSLDHLKADIANDLISAEKSRTRMLEQFELIEKTQNELEKARQKRKSIIILIGIATIMGNILMVFFLNRIIIIKPLAGVISGLKKIAEGNADLTRILVVTSKDELGELAFAFNRFVKKLQSVIFQIQNQMKSLGDSSASLSGISNELGSNASLVKGKAKSTVAATGITVKKIEGIANRAESTKNRVNDVLILSNEVSGKMDRLGHSTNDVFSAVSNVAGSIEQIYASLKEVSRNTGRGTRVTLDASEKADHAAGIVKDLKISAKEVNQVVDLIKEIADQTHLLSFNAAIEAAGAGEAGKGFAVVAREIKELSQKTAAATTTANKKVAAIQSGTDTVISSILSINDVTRETHELMSTIAASVEEQTTAVNGISNNVSHTAAFADNTMDTLKDTLQHEKNLSRELEAVSSDAGIIASDAAAAFDQTQVTRDNAVDVDRAASKALADTQQIESQIQSLAVMYEELEQIVIQFKIR